MKNATFKTREISGKFHVKSSGFHVLLFLALSQIGLAVSLTWYLALSNLRKIETMFVVPIGDQNLTFFLTHFLGPL